MTEECSHENISHLIEHWIEHNESHIQNFKEWAQKAKKDGFLEASEDILEAVDKIEEASEYLKIISNQLFHLMFRNFLALSFVFHFLYESYFQDTPQASDFL